MADRRLTGSAEPASPARAEIVVVAVSDPRARRKVAAPMMQSGGKAAPPGEARRGDGRVGAGDECAGERVDSRSDDHDAQQPGDQADDADDGDGALLLPDKLLMLIEVAPLEGRRRWEQRPAPYWGIVNAQRE